ncbi:MAG TPA: 6-carboxytetrahydropterin synthase [Chitinophagaceae bacterium]|nr:MAG: 6-pyruvoyl-tetrahydropterin synthase [Bacteroidetes bacterium OLB11]HMN33359.1 6-carboxytetrahydropterin synthase [Chitinophagaceae bacterium]
MVYTTRIEYFNAAHKLWNESWTAEQNKEVFGKCANENFHGHNYELYVTVKGEPNPDTGFVINAKDLGKIIKEIVVDKLDHFNLNLDVDFLKGKFTSAENVAIGIWNELYPFIQEKGSTLHCVKLVETKSIYVEYYG